MSISRFSLILSILLTGITCTFAQDVVINEIMSSNSQSLFDEDGETPDWIELFNFSEVPINLQGFGISDDPASPFKWVFPTDIISPQGYIYVFASGKDRGAQANHLETVIRDGDDWKYLLPEEQPPQDWRLLLFDDATWDTGPSGFGYGDGDDATVVDTTVSVFIRKVFNVDDLDNINSLYLHVDYDDAFVAYLNDYEIARANIGLPWTPVSFDETADQNHEAVIYSGGSPELFTIHNYRDLLFPGPNILAIEGHNAAPNSSDFSLIPFLTFGMTEEPPDPVGLDPVLEGALPAPHTNFRIQSNGETLTLTSPLGVQLDSVTFGEIPSDVSFGRQPDGEDNWLFFEESTPGLTNDTEGFTAYSQPPTVAPDPGFYPSQIAVTLFPTTPGDQIYYTLDSSDPTTESVLYEGPIVLDTTSVIRAIAVQPGGLPSEPVTTTYFIGMSTTFPVISLVTDPINLWDEEVGMYAYGNDYDPDPPNRGANFWQDWEKPIHIEFFEPDGQLGFEDNAGIKIFGGWTRFFPEKSVALFSRRQYGGNDFAYQIFPDMDINHFEGFILRNSGSDWDHTMFRDAFMTSLLENVDLDKQAYRPAHVFYDGVYWGIHNIREKLNEHYIASHYGIDKDSLDRMEIWGAVSQGDDNHFQSMNEYIESHDMSTPEAWEHMNTIIDIDNFIDWNAAHIYYDNTDWPGNNNKFWRPHTPTGKWRWFMFDTDFGFGLHGQDAYLNNTLEFALNDGGNDWPNPAYATLLLRRMLENPRFRNDFINRFADYMNTIWDPDFVNARIDQFREMLLPEIQRHLDRWERDYDGWEEFIIELHDFADNRPDPMRGFIMDRFDLPGTAQVELHISPEGGGRILLNTLSVDSFPWSGTYFQEVPVKLSAQANHGYRFTGWEGIDFTDPVVEVALDGFTEITALFEPYAGGEEATVVINEINYHSSIDFDSRDWVELYNNSGTLLDLSGWEFLDSNDLHQFVFPIGTTLEQNSYLVLTRDSLQFRTLFPDTIPVLGNFSFGLSSNGELIRLTDQNGQFVDTVRFGIAAPWPMEPNGTGPTLELINPDYDNALPESWAVSQDHGSPGRENDSFTGVKETGARIFTYKLMASYPNPFNPSTAITFSVPNREHVTLEIFNIQGQLIGTLVNAAVSAGEHRIIWEAGNHSAGVYFYRLSASDFSSVKKCILIK